jgi:hypothetical protein
MKQEEIVLKVSYDEIDSIILEALSISPHSVVQLTSILRFRLREEVPYMQIVKKLEYLHILGKVGKKRRNARIYEYFLI